jgi:peptide/nickel transport system substrate-binding protein
MLKALLGGLGVIGNDNVITQVYPVYSPIPQRVQDVTRAKALLSAAGYPNGFSVTLTTASDTAGLVSMATVAQQMWAAAGSKVTIKSEPGSVYYNTDWLQSPLTVTDWAFRPALGGLLGIAFTSNGIWNASHWKNPTFDRLAAQYDATIDLGQRKAIAKQIEQIMTDETPAILPVFEETSRTIRSNVEGIVADPSSFINYSQAAFSS